MKLTHFFILSLVAAPLWAGGNSYSVAGLDAEVFDAATTRAPRLASNLLEPFMLPREEAAAGARTRTVNKDDRHSRRVGRQPRWHKKKGRGPGRAGVRGARHNFNTHHGKRR